MHRSRADAFRHRHPNRWASIAALVLLPLLLVACPNLDGPPAAVEVELRVSAQGAGRVHVNGTSRTLPYAGDFPQGTEITLRAEADDGHTFERWSGDASGTANPLTLTLTDAQAIDAVFVAEPPPANGAPDWQLADDGFIVTAAVDATTPLTTTVRNEGDAAGTFTVSSDRAWLTADPTSGTLAPGAELALDLYVACPSWGRETAVLTVQGDGASAKLTVDRTCQQRDVEWSTSPGSLVFAGSLLATGEAQPPEQTLTLTNVGTLAAIPLIESDAAWLDASVPSNLVEPGVAANATVAVTPCTEAGRTQATLTVAGGGGATTVAVQRSCDGVEWTPDPTTVALVGLSDGSPVPAGSFTLRNDGNVAATPTAAARADAPAWLVFRSDSPGSVAAGATSSPIPVEVAPCSASGVASAWIDVTGGNATASVQIVRDCREASPFGLSIDRFYVNQSVPAQDTLPGARDVPIVVGRDGLVRAFVTAAEPGTTGASVTLEYRCGSDGGERVVVLAGPPQVPTSTIEGDRSTVYEQRLDADAICANLQVAVAATATGPDGGNVGARWPVSGFAPLTTTAPPPTSFVLVPVALNGGAPPSISSPSAYLADVERLFPFGESTISSIDVGAPFAFTGDLTQGTAWGSLLSEVTTIANADPQGRHHIGVVTPPYDGGVAGIAWVGNGNPSYKAAVVWSKWGFAEVTAHELGHNWGRRHAPCGGVAAPDAEYPYDGGSIGVWGFDLVGDDLKDPANHTDLMGYCNETWVSDYTYAGIAAYRSQFGFSVRTASAPVPGVLLTGVVDPTTGIPTLDPVFAIDARPDAVPAGPYLAVGIASDGTEAFRVPFGTLEVSQHEVEPFRVFVPWRGSAPPPLAALRIERDGVVLVERVAGVRPSAVATVAAERTPDGRVRLSWSAAAYPWARVRDADDGTLLGVGRGGELIVTPVGPRLRVQLGDGLNSVAVDVAY